MSKEKSGRTGSFKEFRTRELQEAIRKSVKSENVLTHFKAVFLVGGPGSGKDFIINTVMNEYHTKEICLDKLVYAIQEANNIEDLKDFPSLVVNGNAENLDAIIVTKAVLESMGYDTAMIYVYTTDGESKTRNDARIARGARTISESVRKEKYDHAIENLHQYTEIFEAFVLYDNTRNYAKAEKSGKKEIVGWLSELAERVGAFLQDLPKNEAASNWITERVLEVGTDATAEFARQITPGQGDSPVAVSYADADKRTTEITGEKNPVSEDKRPKDCDCGKTPCTCGDKNRGGVAVPNANTSEPGPVAEDKKPKKKLPASPPSNYGDVRNMAVGSQGVGFTVEDKEAIKDKIRKKKKIGGADGGLKQTWDAANFGNPGAAALTAPWGQTMESKEPKSVSEIREKIAQKTYNIDEESGN